VPRVLTKPRRLMAAALEPAMLKSPTRPCPHSETSGSNAVLLVGSLSAAPSAAGHLLLTRLSSHWGLDADSNYVVAAVTQLPAVAA
jgi:hypothetical protein